MLKDMIKVSLLQKGQNDRIKNIVSVFYGIQCSLNNFELSATIMTNSSPGHSTSASKTIGLVHTLVRKTFPTPAVHTISPSQCEVNIGIHYLKGCVARCEASNDSVHEPRLVSRSYGVVKGLVLPPGA
jgi:hypothetical protein